MLALYIVCGIVLLFVLLGQVRVRVWADFGEKQRVTAQVGPVKLPLVPAPEKKSAPKKKPLPAKEKPPKPPEKKPKLTLDDITALLSAVGSGLRGMACRARKRLRIEPLRLSVIAGGDPADAAKWYGYLNGIVFTGMPLLESVFRIPDPRIHLDMDCNAEKTRVYGTAGFYLRICDGVAIAAALCKPLLRWYFRWKKAQKAGSDRTAKENKIA